MKRDVLYPVLISAVIIIFVIAVIISACSWTSGGEDIEMPDTNVSFMHHIQPFMQMNCSYSPCHGSDFAGGYSFLTYHNMMMTPSLVVAGSPDQSRLVLILENKVPHKVDFYRKNIRDNHIRGIRQWIKEGAINN